jgi:hypothetical protein
MKKYLFLFFIASLPLSSLAEHSKSVRFVGTEWCPYVCKNKEKPGFLYEYVKYIFKSIEIEQSMEFYTWSRSMEFVKTSEREALLTAGEQDTKGFIKSALLLEYKMCLFTLKSNKWKYKGLDSVKKINLGSIQDYAYGEPLDSYIAKKPEQVMILSGINTYERLLKLVDLKRVDAFVADSMVIQNKVGTKYRNAGCLKAEPLYFAYRKDMNKNLIKIIDGALTDKKNRKKLNEFIRKYSK